MIYLDKKYADTEEQNDWIMRAKTSFPNAAVVACIVTPIDQFKTT